MIDALAALGLDAVSANRGYKGLADPDQMLVAGRLGRVLLTKNTNDLLLLHRAWHAWSAVWHLHSIPRHGGLLLIHSAPGYGVERMAEVVRGLLTHLPNPDDIQNRAFAWNHAIGWHEQ